MNATSQAIRERKMLSLGDKYDLQDLLDQYALELKERNELAVKVQAEAVLQLIGHDVKRMEQE